MSGCYDWGILITAGCNLRGRTNKLDGKLRILCNNRPLVRSQCHAICAAIRDRIRSQNKALSLIAIGRPEARIGHLCRGGQESALRRPTKGVDERDCACHPSQIALFRFASLGGGAMHETSASRLLPATQFLTTGMFGVVVEIWPVRGLIPPLQRQHRARVPPRNPYLSPTVRFSRAIL